MPFLLVRGLHVCPFMNDQIMDRKTVAFYLTLLGVVVLDLVLIVWVLNPFTSLGTSAYASQKVPVVSDAAKPSPFDFADAKRQPVPAARRRPKLSKASN